MAWGRWCVSQYQSNMIGDNAAAVVLDSGPYQGRVFGGRQICLARWPTARCADGRRRTGARTGPRLIGGRHASTQGILLCLCGDGDPIPPCSFLRRQTPTGATVSLPSGAAKESATGSSINRTAIATDATGNVSRCGPQQPPHPEVHEATAPFLTKWGTRWRRRRAVPLPGSHIATDATGKVYVRGSGQTPASRSSRPTGHVPHQVGQRWSRRRQFQ